MDETRLPPWGEELDRAAFERVWRRVMPQDRPDCPFTLDPPDPAPPGSETPLPPTREDRGPLVPQGIAGSDPPDPGETERHREVPPMGELAALAPAVQSPKSPVPQGIADALRRMAQGRQSYRALELRWGLGALGALEREKARQVRELSAALFLLTGKEFKQPANPVPVRVPLAQSLRERYREERSLAGQLRRAGAEAGDPLLGELLPALAGRCEAQARQIWALLARR